MTLGAIGAKKRAVTFKKEKKMRKKLSLDAWAVFAALALATLVRLNLVRVPW